MGQVLPITDRTAAYEALAWLVEAGVDTLVESEPFAWLAAPAALPVQSAEPMSVRAVEHVATPVTTPIPVAFAAAETLAAGTNNLPELHAAISTLAASPPLFADGHAPSGVMLIGEMPGPEDVSAGRLFAGTAGLLLDRMLHAIGRDRSNTYLANLLYWPTTGGRPPEPAEIAAQLPLIRRHITLARPRAILALGGNAAAALLGVNSGINRLRGQWQSLRIDDFEVAVMPTFAPRYLLAHPTHKALAWRDLQVFAAAITLSELR